MSEAFSVVTISIREGGVSGSRAAEPAAEAMNAVKNLGRRGLDTSVL